MAPIIADYWEHAAFPYELVPRIAKLNLGGATIKGHGCAASPIHSVLAQQNLCNSQPSVQSTRPWLRT